MKITVKLFATLRTGKFDEELFNIEPGSDIDYLLKKINIRREDVAIIFINGIHAVYETVIAEGDIVALFPPIGGG